MREKAMSTAKSAVLIRVVHGLAAMLATAGDIRVVDEGDTHERAVGVVSETRRGAARSGDAARDGRGDAAEDAAAAAEYRCGHHVRGAAPHPTFHRYRGERLPPHKTSRGARASSSLPRSPYHSATRSFRSLLDDLLPRPAEEISELIVGGKPRAPGACSTPFGASQRRVKRRVGLVAPILSIVDHGFDRLAIETLIIPEVRCPSPG